MARKQLDPTITGGVAEKLESDLRAHIVGQEDAIAQIINVFQVFYSGLVAPMRPLASFLFLGPTGSGKTRIVEALGESLMGDVRAVIKVDCAEYQHSHEIAKIVGSPPGYLGHRETHPLLSQEVLQSHWTENCKLSLVLFDEVEKASDALWNLLLGILDKATLTLGDNRRVDFSRAMIFMTGNVGAREMASLTTSPLGFAPIHGNLDDKIASSGHEAARKKFTPEFLNRIDKIVVFRPLGTAELRKILDLELIILQERILHAANTKPFILSISPVAKDVILREGTELKYGARHLKRTIERIVTQPLANLLASDQIVAGDQILVEHDGQKMVFSKDAPPVAKRAKA